MGWDMSLKKYGLLLTVYEIEHFYSMGQEASQGKIYCMLYAIALV